MFKNNSLIGSNREKYNNAIIIMGKKNNLIVQQTLFLILGAPILFSPT